MIPGLKAYIQPVLDGGDTYPHHGLYFITSEGRDNEVLGGLLLSGITELFVATSRWQHKIETSRSRHE